MFGAESPLVTTVCIGYACNLKCKHCNISNLVHSNPNIRIKITYDEIVSDLLDKYKHGARIVYFEGGETTMWEDNGKDLGDIIDFARSVGYYNIGYTTNGTTGNIFTNSDVISVSLDGPQDIHDAIRGNGVFNKLMNLLKNIDFDGAIYANMVIQKSNLQYIRATADIVRNNPKIKGIVFNFITPPPYEIEPAINEKIAALTEIEQLKKEGYPILNSSNGIRLLMIEDWSKKCPRYISSFTLPDGSHKMGCPMDGTESCMHCGFDAIREYYLIKRFNLPTIFQMFPIFARSKRK